MKRIIITEGQLHSDSIGTLANELGIDRDGLLKDLSAADAYLCKRLAIDRSLCVKGDRFSFDRVAGVFPVSDLFEIEIIPSFMAGNEDWRADLLLLLVHSRWGSIVDHYSVKTSRSVESGIGDVMAMVYLELFSKVAHVPIRTYRQRRINSFDIEGALDEETVFLPDKDGFSQTITEFSRRNPCNAVIRAAACQLSHSVEDFDLREQLLKVTFYLGVQGQLPPVCPRTVPSRFSNWSELYAVSVGILEGYGIDYTNQGDTLSPAFIVRTSNAWEEFLRRALLLGMKDCTIAYQEQQHFAVRDEGEVKVKPDYILRASDGRKLLVDAKYKCADAKVGTIGNADIYQSWAYMKAAGIRKLILLYPYVNEGMSACFEEFQHVHDDAYEVIGIRVSPFLAGKVDLAAFASELASYLGPMMC